MSNTLEQVVRVDLLKRLSAHMLSDARRHAEFSFKVYAEPVDLRQAKCGTMGCAAGELPGLFPEEWEFVVAGGVNVPTADNELSVRAMADIRHIPSGCQNALGLARFFGISLRIALHLFHPLQQWSCYRHDGADTKLPESASLEDVVMNIDSYIVTQDPGYLRTYNERWGTEEADNDD